MTLSRTEHPRLQECFSPSSVFSICESPPTSLCEHRDWRELRRLPRGHMNSALKQGWKLKGRGSVEFRWNGSRKELYPGASENGN